MPIANFLPTNVDYARFLPELILTLAGVLIMFMEAFRREGGKTNAGLLAILALVLALPAALMASPGPAFQGMLVIDGMATFFRTLVIVVGLLVVFSSTDYLRREHQESGEYYALILFSIVGQCVMVTANELVMIFIGLEISSIASYILAGYLRDDARNNESALKYFLLGSFATAFLLYGVAWMYGATGSTNLTAIRGSLISGTPPPDVLIGVAAALIFVGLAFKISAAPFQGWAPDVYQGAPAPVSAFLTVGPKAAAFAVLIRIFMGSLEPIAARWAPAIWVCALATMLVGELRRHHAIGTLNACWRTALLRMPDYVLVAVAANSGTGSAATCLMFWTWQHTLLPTLEHLRWSRTSPARGERYVAIDDFAGLKAPTCSAGHGCDAHHFSLLSLIEACRSPVDFFGKFYIFEKSALDAKLIWLTVIGLLNRRGSRVLLLSAHPGGHVLPRAR